MSNDNVTPLHGRTGEHTWLLCPCTTNGQPVTPVILHDRQGPIISALVCPNCERTMPVVNGVVQMGESDG